MRAKHYEIAVESAWAAVLNAVLEAMNEPVIIANIKSYLFGSSALRTSISSAYIAFSVGRKESKLFSFATQTFN